MIFQLCFSYTVFTSCISSTHVVYNTSPADRPSGSKILPGSGEHPVQHAVLNEQQADHSDTGEEGSDSEDSSGETAEEQVSVCCTHPVTINLIAAHSSHMRITCMDK